MGRHNRYYTDYSNPTQEASVIDDPIDNAGQADEPKVENASPEFIPEPVVEVETAEANIPVNLGKGKVVNCEMVNVRVSASSDCHIVSVIPKDEEVLITDSSNPDYYMVKTNLNLDGFIKKDFIELI